MTYYSDIVENVKKGNETIFRNIYCVLDVSEIVKKNSVKLTVLGIQT